MEGGIYIISSPYYYKLDCFLARFSPVPEQQYYVSNLYIDLPDI